MIFFLQNFINLEVIINQHFAFFYTHQRSQFYLLRAYGNQKS